MSHDYVALNAMVRKHKAALTRAKKKSPEAVLDAVKDAYSDFDAGLWPDNWHLWQVAEYDAKLAIQRAPLGPHLRKEIPCTIAAPSTDLGESIPRKRKTSRSWPPSSVRTTSTVVGTRQETQSVTPLIGGRTGRKPTELNH